VCTFLFYCTLFVLYLMELSGHDSLHETLLNWLVPVTIVCIIFVISAGILDYGYEQVVIHFHS